ncbi:hypothetical protein [Clostridium ganghwense]|uniref:HNH endonuclease n=1 Tax=Clostridium ganghwense TaxID=312089 RepID=A0ABT4CQ98_9CLOT|nr:hypothetical protein [Clostridium ganghwense]MCY6371224.1 hypothetical protein [Clostridium ganghwense]
MYYVYENWTADKKAVIHRGECRFCNNGKGTGKGTLGESNGKWHGGYLKYQDAKKKAESLENREVRECKFCIK